MSGGGEYEPKDSRKVTGTKGDPDKSWRDQENARDGRGEYEPRDSRNATGQQSGEPDRWKKDDAEPLRADGTPTKAEPGTPGTEQD
jgi:hypothetical protein